MKELESNKVEMSGVILSNFEFCHYVFGEGFYTAFLGVTRKSGVEDKVIITVSDRMVDVTSDWVGESVEIKGTLRSHNDTSGEKTRVILSVFVEDMDSVERLGEYNKNEVFLEGTICKQPIYRETNNGREITDVILAVNRPYGKSDYIYCICWGRNAMYVSNLSVGDKVKVFGRFQSRDYQKLIDGEYVTKTAYELSVQRVELIER